MIDMDNVPIPIFQKHINNAFGDIFPQKLISTLANMLAIDFVLRKNDAPNSSPETKASACIENIKAYIAGSGQTFDDSFGSATILFSVALSPPKNNNVQSINQLENKEGIVDAYIAAHMPELRDEAKTSMSDVLATLLASDEADSMINFISRDPKLIIAINARYTEKLQKVRTQLIVGEILKMHAAQNNLKNIVSVNNIATIESLVQDLAKYKSLEEYLPKSPSSLTKGSPAPRRGL